MGQSANRATLQAKLRSTKIGKRVGVAFTFGPLLLLLSWLGGIWLLVLVDLIIILGLLEFCRMWKVKGIVVNKGLAIILSLSFGWNSFLNLGLSLPFLFTFLFFILLVSELFRGVDGALFRISASLLAIFYLGWLATYLLSIGELNPEVPHWGGSALILIFLVIWSVDTGAYFSGLAWGSHKITPQISPNKTWEGTIGGFLGGIFASLLLWFLSSPLHPFLPSLPLNHYLVVGGIAGVGGQVGDMIESLMKRDSEIKDASSLIPGHGGILDRFDSLLFIAPLEYYYLKLILS